MPAAAGVLVSNTDDPSAFTSEVAFTQARAQQFLTGINAGGYTLSGIAIVFNEAVGTPAKLRVELWSATGGNPGTKLASLTVPSSVPNRLVFFDAPENTVLQAFTSYFVVVYSTGTPKTTGTLAYNAFFDGEDPAGEGGWYIGNRNHQRPSINSGSWGTIDDVMQIQVIGFANRPAPGAQSFRRDPLPWTATLNVARANPVLFDSTMVARKKKDGDGEYITCTNNSGLASNEWCSSGQVYERVRLDTISDYSSSDAHGCSSVRPGAGCAPIEQLTDNYFSYGGTGYRVTQVTLSGGTLSFSLDKAIPEGLKTASLRVGSKWLALADATVYGTTAQWGNTGLSWSTGNNIALRLDTTYQAGEGPSGPGATQHSGELTASFEEVPEEHDGTGFAFLVRFSEVLGASYSRTLRKKSFSVSGGRVKKVKQVDAGLWRVRVSPRSWKRDVSVTLAGGRDCDADGTVCTPDGRELANTSSVSVRGPVRIEVKGGKALEGRDAEIAFVVTLSRAASAEVTVDYTTETEDGTATAGEDYAETSGTLTFAVGETEKTVPVEILDDAVDENRENFKLTLSNAWGAYILDDEATGRILNDDPAP